VTLLPEPIRPLLPELQAALRAHAEPARLAAEALAPPIQSDPGVRVPVYREDLSWPARMVRFQDRFQRWDELPAAVAAGDAGAVVIGLELLSIVAPTETMPLAERLLAADPWNLLSRAVGQVLARSNTAHGFEILLGNLDAYGFDVAFPLCGWEAGGDAAFARLKQLVDVVPEVELPPWSPTAEPPEPTPIDPAHRTAAQGLIGYLAHINHGPADHWMHHAALHHGDPAIRLAAASAWLRTPDRREAAEPWIDLADKHLRRLAFLAAFQTHPHRPLDLLGGPQGAAHDPRAVDLMTTVLQDARTLRHHEQGLTTLAGEGWLERDPRWVEVALSWLRDRNSKDLARGLLTEAPADVVAAARAKGRRR